LRLKPSKYLRFFGGLSTVERSWKAMFDGLLKYAQGCIVAKYVAPLFRRDLVISATKPKVSRIRCSTDWRTEYSVCLRRRSMSLTSASNGAVVFLDWSWQIRRRHLLLDGRFG
jgi:hypothetical protein